MQLATIFVQKLKTLAKFLHFAGEIGSIEEIFRPLMAQESWKNEIDETELHTPEGPILCSNNCGFFGSAVTNNLCSKCYRDFITKQKLEKPPSNILPSSSQPATQTVAEAKDTADPKGKQPANRCGLCKKKVGLTGFQCRCGGTYCSTHRYSESHQCAVDYKELGREAIKKSNPVIKADKIDKI
ncbi:hypothetical protein LUZ60_006645 [Juncus effusus]|nr:hypothetical protein LUZ60_006645 [Juncus effusus]